MNGLCNPQRQQPFSELDRSGNAQRERSHRHGHNECPTIHCGVAPTVNWDENFDPKAHRRVLFEDMEASSTARPLQCQTTAVGPAHGRWPAPARAIAPRQSLSRGAAGGPIIYSHGNAPLRQPRIPRCSGGWGASPRASALRGAATCAANNPALPGALSWQTTGRKEASVAARSESVGPGDRRQPGCCSLAGCSRRQHLQIHATTRPPLMRAPRRLTIPDLPSLDHRSDWNQRHDRPRLWQIALIRPQRPLNLAIPSQELPWARREERRRSYRQPLPPDPSPASPLKLTKTIRVSRKQRAVLGSLAARPPRHCPVARLEAYGDIGASRACKRRGFLDPGQSPANHLRHDGAHVLGAVATWNHLCSTGWRRSKGRSASSTAGGRGDNASATPAYRTPPAITV